MIWSTYNGRTPYRNARGTLRPAGPATNDCPKRIKGTTALTAALPDLRDAPRPAEPFELVAIDIDGTLLRTDKRLSKRTVARLEQATERGVHVVLASARPPRSVREIYARLGLATMQINYNGALVYDPPFSRVVSHRPLPVPLARQVVQLARELNPTIAVSVEILDRWYTDHVDRSVETETSRTFEPDYVGPLQVFLNRPVTKLMLLAKPEKLAPVKAQVEDAFRGQIGVAISDPHLMQIIHPAVDKGAALQEVATHYGVEQRRVMAIGDAPNDAGMLRWAGLGVAVQNAWPQALEACDAVVPCNNEEGVAYALEKYVL